MKAIKLKCRTEGFAFGEIVEVGTGKEKINVKKAEALVGGKLAEEYVAPVNGADKKIAKENEELSKKVANLEKEKATEVKRADDAETKVANLEKEIEALKSKK